MQEKKSGLQSLFHTGIRAEMTHTQKKQLLLTNRLALLSLPLILTVALLDAFVRDVYFSAAIDLIFILLFASVFSLNFFGKTLLSRILLAVGFPFSLLAGNILLQITTPGPPYLEQFITDRYFLLICAVLPSLLFDLSSEKKAFFAASVLCFASLLALDPLNIYFGFPLSDGFLAAGRNTAFLNQYYLINLFLSIVWFMLYFSVFFLKRMNRKFEFDLALSGKKMSNRSLKIDKRNSEMAVHNEELQQQQEELLSQRDFIDAQNEELKSVHHKIQTSVRAALHIQTSVLPTEQDLTALGNYFLIFKPKDVVSGDYYWAYRDGRNVFLAAADCTGHGVPGAFMTMIAATQLEKIVRVQRVNSPSEILEKLVVDIRQILRQEETGNRDGMEIAVLRCSTNGRGKILLRFAGAKMSARFIDPDGNFKELKGERFAIGRSAAGKVFSEHQSAVLPGTMLYLASDGLAGQNNPRRQKYTDARLNRLFERHYSKACEEQKALAEADFDLFRENEPQRDDIMVLGVRLKLPYSEE